MRHCQVNARLQEGFDGFEGAVEQILNNREFVAGEGLQDVAGRGHPPRWATNAEPGAGELLTEMLDEGFHAIMPTSTPFAAQAQCAQRQIQFVEDNQDVLDRNFVKVDHWPDGRAADVHAGLGFGEDDGMPGDVAAADDGFALDAGEFDVGRGRELIHCHKTDVVPGVGVLPPRIAQTDDEEFFRFHKRLVY